MSGCKIPTVQKAVVEASNEGISVRSGPFADAPVSGVLPDGAVVAVFRRFGSWFRVRYNDTEGFVSGDNITLVAEQ